MRWGFTVCTFRNLCEYIQRSFFVIDVASAATAAHVHGGTFALFIDAKTPMNWRVGLSAVEPSVDRPVNNGLTDRPNVGPHSRSGKAKNSPFTALTGTAKLYPYDLLQLPMGLGKQSDARRWWTQKMEIGSLYQRHVRSLRLALGIG